MTELNNFELIDVSHLTHPDWKEQTIYVLVLAFPVIFEPILTDKECYGDGWLKSNYPIEYCLKNGCQPKEILVYTVTEKIDQETNRQIKTFPFV